MASSEIIGNTAAELANEAKGLAQKAQNLASQAQDINRLQIEASQAMDNEFMAMLTLFTVSLFLGYVFTRKAPALGTHPLVMYLIGAAFFVAVAGVTVFAQEGFLFAQIIGGIGIGLASAVFMAVFFRLRQDGHDGDVAPGTTSTEPGDLT